MTVKLYVFVLRTWLNLFVKHLVFRRGNNRIADLTVFKHCNSRVAVLNTWTVLTYYNENTTDLNSTFLCGGCLNILQTIHHSSLQTKRLSGIASGICSMATARVSLSQEIRSIIQLKTGNIFRVKSMESRAKASPCQDYFSFFRKKLWTISHVKLLRITLFICYTLSLAQQPSSQFGVLIPC